MNMAQRHTASVDAQQAADAANQLFRLDQEDDQEALLEVLDMYFCGPCNPCRADSDAETGSIMERGA